MELESKLESMVCPEGHNVPYARWNYARDFSGNERDAMTLEPLFESGLYCHACEKAYGLSKLKALDNVK